jgi:hypothetical protein
MKAIVTFCDQNYRPGLEVLVKSIRRWSDIEIICLTEMTEQIEGCKFIKPTHIIEDRVGKGWPYPYFVATEAFGWTQYDLIIIMQPDMIIVGDLNRILKASLPDFGTVPAYGQSPPPQHAGMRGFNDGLVIIKPNEEMRDRVMQINGFGAQVALNDYASLFQWPCELPYTWNMSKRWFSHFKGAWNMIKDEIVVLHYVGKDKPWHTEQDENYAKLNDLWRAYRDGDFAELPESF